MTLYGEENVLDKKVMFVHYELDKTKVMYIVTLIQLICFVMFIMVNDSATERHVGIKIKNLSPENISSMLNIRLTLTISAWNGIFGLPFSPP